MLGKIPSIGADERVLFNSYFFILVFLPMTLAAFAVARKNSTAGLIFLVASSLIFYGWWSVKDLILLVTSTAVNFAVAHAIQNARGGAKRLALLLGVSLNLGTLAYFKYLDLFGSTIAAAAGTTWTVRDIALPLAISFFTFQQIANLVDVYRGVPAERSILRYAFYVTFFPHLIAGPIVYHKDLSLQVDSPPFSPWSGLSVGLTLFVLGLAQKVLLADYLSPYADEVFTAVGTAKPVSFVDAWGGAVAFSLQIYFDFGGYSLMAVGLGRMFGYSFPYNFLSPYKATSFVDFWRRWHRSLSGFFRDHLYVPLGGNRGGGGRTGRNVLVTMILAGLWHGASWTFAAWGLIHGLLIVLNHAWRTTRWSKAFAEGDRSAIARFAMRLLMFVALTLTWVIFRSPNFETLGTMLQTLLRPGDGAFEFRYLEDPGVLFPALSMLIVFVTCAPNAAELVEPFRPTRWKAAGLGFLFVVCLFQLTKAKEFIYFHF